ncbi:ATP synthase F0 subunit B, partial [Methanocalculus natronophilus]|uniref:ATP synthase F0 subunit B n=1 Tax=Methanocalculus natronophilus TaxID=1262400 RepID=UPI0031B5650F
NKLDEAKKEAQKLVEDAKNRGEDTRRDIIREAKEEAEKIKKNAKKDMDKEIEMARNKLQNEAVEIAMFLTE